MNRTTMTWTVAVTAALSIGTVRAMLDDAAAEKAARDVLAKMTLEEKVALLGGSGTMTLAPLARFGITNEWTFSDNSSTVRPAMERWSWNYAEPQSTNTKLPSLSALAQTWDVEMARRHGETLGAEMRDRGVDCLLGPGVNIARTPLNGRNWEYLGEDPCLAAKLCVPLIRGIQSYDVAATVKHFCLNNQERNRNAVDTHCDARTFNEIYLPAFRAAVVDAGVLAVMSSYNKVDGLWASENKYLQRGVLRERLGFKGLLMTDWGGQHSGAFAANNGGGVDMNRGQDIRFNYYALSNAYPLAVAVRTSQVPAATVDEMAFRTLWTMAKTGYLTGTPRKGGARNTVAHQRLARLEGAESVVLLKNEGKILPLDARNMRKVLVIGRNADEKQCRKGCSAEGNVPYEITLFAALKARLPEADVRLMPFCAKRTLAKTDTKDVATAGGHAEQKGQEAWSDPAALKAAVAAADTVIVFTGTELGYQENMESECRDRENMDLPAELQTAMRTILSWKHPRTVVVSRSGTPVGYDWTELSDTLVQTSYLGMEEGNAIADVLFGDVNPCGRLCHTWPRSYSDTPVARCGTYNATNVVYNERFYVGYRWYDHAKIKPLFPFGYGLSYTTFAVGKAAVAKSRGVRENFAVVASVKNKGDRAGRAVVQVYVAYPDATVERCAKDLRGFAKTKLLQPREECTVEIVLTPRDFAYWDVVASRFRTDPGRYGILIGTSAADILSSAEVVIDRDWEFRD